MEGVYIFEKRKRTEQTPCVTESRPTCVYINGSKSAASQE